MADENDEEEDAPAVELGDGESVEGAPIARVASRLTWALQKSEIVRREGDTTIRTPDGPQTVESVLADVDITYFETRREFVQALEDAVGTGPVQTE
ncbi:DUF5789 family protein [Halobacterium wangiae]|uniref:DUF5789 family protein n=1 Tax=Halobacterium wangiae TaxID=2902623 RepID=UPI001E4081C9|nr:DUF5789 family protein [Halobacterium wangiae]